MHIHDEHLEVYNRLRAIHLPLGLRIWMNRHSSNPEAGVDMKRCRASVQDRGGGSFAWINTSQCTRPGKVERHGLLWCGQHDPDAIRKRLDEAAERRKAAWESHARQQREEARIATLKDAALMAIRSIAKGHNCPFELARAILKDNGENPDA